MTPSMPAILMGWHTRMTYRAGGFAKFSALNSSCQCHLADMLQLTKSGGHGATSIESRRQLIIVPVLLFATFNLC
jgi:hypothetical protein